MANCRYHHLSAGQPTEEVETPEFSPHPLKFLGLRSILARIQSSISIIRLAQSGQGTRRVLRVHFFTNPVPLKGWLKSFAGLATTVQDGSHGGGFCKGVAKARSWRKGFACFGRHRILLPMLNEAFFALVKARRVDGRILIAACNWPRPRGPNHRRSDQGSIHCWKYCALLQNDFGDPKYARAQYWW